MEQGGFNPLKTTKLNGEGYENTGPLNLPGYETTGPGDLPSDSPTPNTLTQDSQEHAGAQTSPVDTPPQISTVLRKPRHPSGQGLKKMLHGTFRLISSLAKRKRQSDKNKSASPATQSQKDELARLEDEIEKRFTEGHTSVQKDKVSKDGTKPPSKESVGTFDKGAIENAVKLGGGKGFDEDAPEEPVLTPEEVKEIEKKSDFGDEFDEVEKNEKPKNRREKIAKMTKEFAEGWNTLPIGARLFFSGTLVGASFLAASSGSLVFVGGVYAAKLGVRALGSYGLGKTAENWKRNKILGKDTERTLTEAEEKSVRNWKWGTMLGVFLGGTLAEYFAGGIPKIDGNDVYVPTAGNLAHMASVKAITEAAEQAAVQESISHAPVVDIASHTAQHVQQMASTLSHVETVKVGDTLTSLITRGALWDAFPHDEIAKLTLEGKERLVGNIVSHLSVDQLKEIGVSSGDANLIKVGESLDLDRLAEIAKSVTVNVSGEKVSLLSRLLSGH